MSRIGLLITLGILTMLTPFSGLPISIRTFLTIVWGAASTAIAFGLRAHEARVKQELAEETLERAMDVGQAQPQEPPPNVLSI